ncbi:MAG: hypothetical protein CL610_19985 [Anaerolineaceae bacterium]|nr:hypothetical protein [Anaerolineaceae bacterium]
MGFSVIPVHTDSKRAKVAAVSWKPYQQRQATEAELQSWFIEQGFTGIGIVTGAVSQLMVLDFDDRHPYERFCHAYPDLRQTCTVRTRRGWHLHYALPSGFHLSSRKGQGVDLKAEGGYVVAPPTIIDGHSYYISQAVPPKCLSEKEIESMLTFFTWANPDTPLPAVRRQEGAFSCEIEGIGNDCPQPQRHVLTVSDLQFLYQHLATRGSRNEALFRVSLRARDTGWTQEATVAALAKHHMQQPANHAHRKETPQQRHAEALHTIASAFSRGGRMFIPGLRNYDQVPNSVREKCFQMKQTHVVRVLEGLRLAGIQPGQAFTTNQALRLLKGRVGRDSVYAALKAKTEGGTAVFESTTPPLDTPKGNAYADTHLSKGQTKNAFLLGIKNQEKGGYHRPARVFTMPTNLELCRKLQVKLTYGDPLTQADLSSAKQTRMAVHRAFIQRRPGMYPRRWLARRLGVGTVTLDAYNREIPINVRHCYAENPISWRNIHAIPDSLDLPGTFLQDDTGKRYPAKQVIARRLLAQKRSITLNHQAVNFYWYGELPQWSGPVAARAEPAVQQVFAPFQPFMPPYQPGVSQHKSARDISTKEYPHMQPTAHRADAEKLAARVYQQVNRLAASDQQISRANARKLVDTYGVGAVRQTLDRLRHLHKQGMVRNPAGFLVTASRVLARASNF